MGRMRGRSVGVAVYAEVISKSLKTTRGGLGGEDGQRRKVDGFRVRSG
jgi:hypothetical protein